GLDGIGADPQDVAPPPAEFLRAGAEGGDLGGADQREIARVKQQDQPAVAVVVEPDLPGRTRPTGTRQLKLRGTPPDACRLDLHDQRPLVFLDDLGAPLLTTRLSNRAAGLPWCSCYRKGARPATGLRHGHDMRLRLDITRGVRRLGPHLL